MSSAYAIAAAVIAVIGFLVWFARSQKRSAMLMVREAEIRQIAKINQGNEKIDARTEKILGEVASPDFDPRAMWLHDQKRIPDVPDPGTPGNQV